MFGFQVLCVISLVYYIYVLLKGLHYRHVTSCSLICYFISKLYCIKWSLAIRQPRNHYTFVKVCNLLPSTKRYCNTARFTFVCSSHLSADPPHQICHLFHRIHRLHIGFAFLRSSFFFPIFISLNFFVVHHRIVCGCLSADQSFV
jgi:hypothetical protein